jgi:hypothetical protein
VVLAVSDAAARTAVSIALSIDRLRLDEIAVGVSKLDSVARAEEDEPPIAARAERGPGDDAA